MLDLNNRLSTMKFSTAVFLMMFYLAGACQDLTFSFHVHVKFSPETGCPVTSDPVSTVTPDPVSPVTPACGDLPKDCSDIKTADSNAKNGIYTITPSVGSGPIKVYCDMTNDGGGWTVIQRRTDGSEDFYRNWADYKNGFGSLENEFWLGNENIYRITNQLNYSIRFDLEDFTKGKRYAVYDMFYKNGEEEKYSLHMSGYSGDAGDAMPAIGKGTPFSTKDQDNDSYSGSCAELFIGAWWYANCHSSNLNGQYNNTEYAKGLTWHPLTGFHTSLKSTTMKIRQK